MAFSVSYNIRAIDEFSKTLKNIKKNFSSFNQEISSGFKKTGVASNKFNKDIEAVKKNTSKVSSNLKSMSNNVRTNNLSAFDRVVQNIGNSVSNVGNKIKSSFGGIGKGGLIKGLAIGGIVASSAVKASDISQDRLRLSGLIDSSKELDNVISRLRAKSLLTNKSMTELSDTYGLLIEQGDTKKQAFSQLSRQLDLSAYTGISSNEMTDLFNRIKSSGVATTDVIEMLNRRKIALYPLIAKKLNISYEPGRIRQSVLQAVAGGALSSKDFDEIMREYLDIHKNIKGMAQKMARTGTIAPLIRIKNAFFDVTASIWESFAATTHLNGGLNLLANGMSNFANSFRDFSKNHTTTAGLLSTIAGLSLFRGGLALTKGVWKSFISLLTGKGFINSFKVLGSELLKPFIELKSIFGWLGSKFGSFIKFFGGTGAGLMLTPQTIGGGDLSKRKYDFYNNNLLPSKPQMNMNNQTNTENLYNLLGMGNQQMTSNVNLNIESTNANIKSMETQHTGGRSNFNVGVNLYRR